MTIRCQQNLKLATLLVIFLLGSLVLSPLSANRALLVGIEAYPVQPLKGPLIDVESARRLAKEVWGFKDAEILVLRDHQATRENILNSIERWLIQETKPGDRVLFYFSGHGHFVPDENGDEVDGLDETIVPFDVYFKDETFYGMIVDDEIDVYMHQLADRDAIFIFDSCHSGTVTRNHPELTSYQQNGYSIVKRLDPAQWRSKRRSAVVPSPSAPSMASVPALALADTSAEVNRIKPAFTTPPSTAEIWTAVTSYQLAFTDLVRGHGSVFTNALVEGLADWKADLNGNGKISRAELLKFVRDYSNAFCSETPQCKAGITPTLEIRKDLLLASYDAWDTVTSFQETTTEGENENFPESQFLSQNQSIEQVVEHSSANAVRVALHPKGSIPLGSPLKIQVYSERSGHLILLDLGTTGELRQIYPNHYIGCLAGEIKAGRTVELPGATTLPFEFFAAPPAGRGLLAALVIHDPSDISSLTCQHHELHPIEGVQEYLGNLAEAVTKVWSGDEFDRALEWSGAVLEYEIINRSMQ